MLFWRKTRNHATFGIVLDIGSGSVGVGIVAVGHQRHPHIVWSTREYAPFTGKITHAEALNGVLHALKTALHECGTNGIRTLAIQYPHARIAGIEATVAAPWGHTITRTVSVRRDASFVVTEQVLEELHHTAAEQARAALKRDEHVAAQLTALPSTMTAFCGNGYTIAEPLGTTARDIQATVTSPLIYRRLHNAIEEYSLRSFPNVVLKIQTFMHQFHTALATLPVEHRNVALIDVTAEATEAGIVRDAILQTVTYTPYGIHSIARELADACAIPPKEALAYVRNEEDVLEVREGIDDVTTLYQTNIVELFERLGGRIAVPETVLVHTDARTESFFATNIAAALKRLTGTAPHVVPVTSAFFSGTGSTDSSLLLSAHAMSVSVDS